MAYQILSTKDALQAAIRKVKCRGQCLLLHSAISSPDLALIATKIKAKSIDNKLATVITFEYIAVNEQGIDTINQRYDTIAKHFAVDDNFTVRYYRACRPVIWAESRVYYTHSIGFKFVTNTIEETQTRISKTAKLIGEIL